MKYGVRNILIHRCVLLTSVFYYLTVLRKTIWSFNTNCHVISIQCANDIIHGNRIVCASIDFGSCNRITSDSFNCGRRFSVRVLFYDGRNKSSNHHRFISSNHLLTVIIIVLWLIRVLFIIKAIIRIKH